MTADTVSALEAIASILGIVGKNGFFGLVFLATLAPELVLLVIYIINERRFSKVVSMYKNNVELVKTTQDLAKALNETVAYNTQVMTEVKDAVEHNLFCPLVRQKTQPKIEEVSG